MRIPSIAAACLLAWPVALHAQSMDALYEKAKAEGELVIYGGGPTSLYEVPANAFKQKYPGIKVTIHAGFSNVHNAKINEMIKAKANDADLAILQTVSDFYDWKKAGVLAQYRPEGSEFIDQTFKDPDGYFTGIFVTAVAYAYNPQLVKPDNVPKSAMDFLKPEFKGKMISCYPHDDDITLYLFYSIVKRYGWDWMDKYLANGASFIQGHLGVARSVSAGESMVTIDSNPNLSLRENARRQAAEDRLLRDRSDADLGADRGDLQGFTASERGAAVPELVPAEGAADQADRHLVGARRRAAARRHAAGVLADAGQPLRRIPRRRSDDRGLAQEVRDAHRPGQKNRRRALAVKRVGTFISLSARPHSLNAKSRLGVTPSRDF